MPVSKKSTKLMYLSIKSTNLQTNEIYPFIVYRTLKVFVYCLYGTQGIRLLFIGLSRYSFVVYRTLKVFVCCLYGTQGIHLLFIWHSRYLFIVYKTLKVFVYCLYGTQGINLLLLDT